MKDNQVEEFKGYPSELAPSSVKRTTDYGVQYFKAMWAEHENSNLANSDESRQERYIMLRKAAEGLSSIDKFKDLLSTGGDNSHMNLDWSSISVIPKFVEVIVNGMLDQSYKIQCNAIDKLSKGKKDKKRNELLGNMFMAAKIHELPEHVREKLLPKDAEVPEDKDALDLYMTLNYKQATEIAMEQGIEYTLYNNDWKHIETQVLKDITTLNIAGTRIWFDENDQIRLRYIDPLHLITSYSKDPRFESVRHSGEIIQMTIAELRVASDNEFTEKEYWKIAKTWSGRNGNKKWNQSNSYYDSNISSGGHRNYDDFLIDILDGEFHCSDKFVWDKKSNNFDGYYFQDREDDFELPPKSKGARELVVKELKVVYEGKWIIGSDYMYDYKLKENMIRPKDGDTYSPEVQGSFIIVAPNIRDMENKGMVEKMLPFADQMQLIHLKLQQLIAKSRPKGVAIDVSAISGVMKGAGFESFKPIDMQKMFDQMGSYYYSSIRDDGTPIQNTRPIEELNNGIGNDIQPLIMLYNQYLQQLRDVTGVNEVRDASAPSRDSLVGVDKLRLMASNNATKGINFAYLDIYERTAKTIVLMIQDSVESGNKIEGWYNAIGEQNVKTIEISGNEISLVNIGIKIEALPDEQERQVAEGNIQQALAAGTLRLEDSILVRQVLKQSVKLANQLLIHRTKTYQQEKSLEAQQAMQMNAQVQQQSLQAKAEADAQLAQQQAAIEVGKLEAEHSLKSTLSAQEHEQKMKEIALANQYKAEQIKLAGDENFKNTALSKEQPQPRVMPGTRTS